MKQRPTPEEIRSYMEYDKSSGVVRWKVRRHGRGGVINPGDAVGSVNAAGYLETRVNGYRDYVHRIAWALHYGAWPTQNIDHIDGDKRNNRISNLRDCSQRVNVENQRIVSRNNTSGFTGVVWRADKKRWSALIQVDGKRKRLGGFDTPEQAHAAYLSAKRIMHQGNTL
jgi:HNH endonuclease/AP2 domain